MTSEQTIETLRDKINDLARAQVEQAAGMGAVRAINGADNAKTAVTVKVIVERIDGNYEMRAEAAVSQTQTDKLDPVEDGFDPDQLILKGVR
jgi:ribulose bisphosphate carboxylase small subunit